MSIISHVRDLLRSKTTPELVELVRKELSMTTETALGADIVSYAALTELGARAVLSAARPEIPRIEAEDVTFTSRALTHYTDYLDDGGRGWSRLDSERIARILGFAKAAYARQEADDG